MPIYEYLCERCGETTEAIQRHGDPPPAECPKCGGPLRKKMSAPAFQFKGSGWYVTDYARKGGESAEKSSGSAESSGGGEESSAGPVKKAEPRTDSKAEPKAEPRTKTETSSKSSKD
jgi:putative FmdB family regulatory protein